MNKLLTCKYVPIISVKPAEMKALRNMYRADRESLMPLIRLRPWMSSNAFENTLDKINESYEKSSWWLATMDTSYDSTGKTKDSVKTYHALCSPDDGFSRWCELVEREANLIPVIQLGDGGENDIKGQASRLSSLGRGLVLHLEMKHTYRMGKRQLIDLALRERGDNALLLVMDCGNISGVDLTLMHQINQLIEGIAGDENNLSIAISSTSFPTDFSINNTQPIWERQIFDQLLQFIEQRGYGAIYSDHASVAEPISGGSGVLYPRVDVPELDKWSFYRSDYPATLRDDEKRGLRLDATREQLYQLMCQRALKENNDSLWLKDANVWGARQIRDCAEGRTRISSPGDTTAIRINMHMFRQVHFDDPTAIGQEEDWSD